MTGLDWLIIVFALMMGIWGYQQGLIVSALSLVGFAVGAFLGSRLGPALLPDGSESPYAPATALAGALLIGGIVAISVESLAHHARRRVLGPAGRRRPVAVAEALGGGLLLLVLGLALVWLFGAVALNTPGASELRTTVQRSAILRALNEAFPPSGDLLNVLNRIDPGGAIRGPDPSVGPPDSKIAQDPEVRAAQDGVVRVLGTACGLGIEGSGWIVRNGLVVTNAHVIAGEEDTTVSFGDEDERHDATPVHYDPSNDLAILRVSGIGGRELALAPEVRSGTSGAVLGYPENGPLTVTPARVGATDTVISEDSYGRGPIQRELTALRGEVRSGNSGGPLVDGKGRVLTTVFASTTGGRQEGGYGVPNEVVEEALGEASGEVTTGACTH
ncbi:MAG: MarP family serine protease [Solirubrobacterales bacterium]